MPSKKNKQQTTDSIPTAENAHQTSFSDQQLIHRYYHFYAEESLAILKNKFQTINNALYFSQFEIDYAPERIPYTDIDLQIVDQSINSEIVILKVKWGKFILDLRILNLSERSKIHQASSLRGSYGLISNIKFDQKDFVVKCIPFAQWLVKREAKIMAIKEYTLLRVAGAIGIGPAITDSLGFDLVMYDSCVEFAMEKCDEVSEFEEEDIETLWENLYLMHAFQIIHFDIKPQNLMKSRLNRKIVFIDFGLAEVSSIQVGQRLSIFFRGTLQYSSPQMVETFISRNKSRVDLYFNDAHCLNMAIKYMKNRLKCVSLQFPENSLNISLISNDSTFLLFLIKLALFQGKIQKALNLIEKYQRIQHLFSQKILDFLYQITPCSEIRQFYQLFLFKYRIEDINYKYLSKIYRSSYSMMRFISINAQKKQALQTYWAEIISQKSENVIDCTNLQKIKIFLSSEKVQSIEIQVYFSYYLSYISFSNNKYSVNMKQRSLITQTMIKNRILALNLLLQHKQQHQSDFSLVKMAIQSIFDAILTKKYEKGIINKRYILNILFLALEHLFITNIQNELSLMSRLETLIKSQFLDDWDKLEALLIIKHQRNWLLYRYKGNGIYHFITDWCFQQIIRLQLNFPSSFSWLLNYLRKNWLSEKLFQLTEQQQRLISQIESKQLQQELFLQMMSEQMMFESPSSIPAKVRQIYKHIPVNMRRKVYYFQFLLSDIYFERLSDIDKCREIMLHIKQNLQSQEVMNPIFIDGLFNMIYSTQPRIFLTLLLQFLSKVDINTITSHHEAVKEVISRFNFINFDKNLQALYQQVMKKLQIVVGWLDIDSLFAQGYINRPHGHCCINCKGFSNIILVKQFYYQMAKIPYSLLKDLSIIRDKCLPAICMNCHLAAQTLYQLKNQQYLIKEYRLSQNIHNVQAEKQMQLVKSFEKVSQLSKRHLNKQITDYFLKIQGYNIFDFCKISQQLQVKHGGISMLYLYLKKRGSLLEFLNEYQQNSQNLIATMQTVLLRISMRELAYFLVTLTIFMTKMELSSAFHLLFNSFQQFMYKYRNRINCMQLLNFIRVEENRPAEIGCNIYNCVYYFIILLYLPLSQRERTKIGLFKLIAQLPNSIKEHINALYFRYLLIENNRRRNEDMMNKRKRDDIQYRLIKLLTQMGKRSISSGKRKQRLNIKINILCNKADRIGGPYDMKSPQMNKLRVKVSIRSSIHID